MADIPVSLGLQLDQNSLLAIRRQIDQTLSNVRLNISQQQLARHDVRGRPGQEGANYGESRFGPYNAEYLKGQVTKQKELKSALNATQTQLLEFKRAQDAASTSTQLFAERVGLTTKRLAAYLIPAATIFQLTRGFSIAASSIKDINTEITRLTQVLDGNSQVAVRITDEVLTIAQKMGQSGKELLDITTILAQAGSKFGPSNIVSIVEELSKTKLAATFGDIKNTTNGLIAILGQFNLAGTETNRILTVTNELAKKFAVESGDILTAVQTGGGSFSAAGGSFEEFASLFTSIRETTRLSPSVIGTAISTLSQRSLRPDVVQLQEALTKNIGGVRNQKGELLPIMDRLFKLAEATQGYSAESMGRIVREMSGDRNAKVYIPALQDMQRGDESITLNALKASKNRGSLDKDAEMGLKSIKAQMDAVGAAFDKAFGKLSNDPTLTKFIKDLGSLGQSLASILEVAAPLIPILIKLGTIKLGVSVVSSMGHWLKGFRSNITGENIGGMGPGGIMAMSAGPGGRSPVIPGSSAVSRGQELAFFPNTKFSQGVNINGRYPGPYPHTFGEFSQAREIANNRYSQNTKFAPLRNFTGFFNANRWAMQNSPGFTSYWLNNMQSNPQYFPPRMSQPVNPNNKTEVKVDRAYKTVASALERYALTLQKTTATAQEIANAQRNLAISLTAAAKARRTLRQEESAAIGVVTGYVTQTQHNASIKNPQRDAKLRSFISDNKLDSGTLYAQLKATQAYNPDNKSLKQAINTLGGRAQLYAKALNSPFASQKDLEDAERKLALAMRRAAMVYERTANRGINRTYSGSDIDLNPDVPVRPPGRMASVARGAGRFALAAAPYVGLGMAEYGLQQSINEQQKTIKDVVDAQGNLIGDFAKILENNRIASKEMSGKTGVQWGLGTGALAGWQAGGPWGAAIGAITGGVGGYFAGKGFSSADKDKEQQLLTLAARSEKERDSGRLLGTFLTDLRNRSGGLDETREKRTVVYGSRPGGISVQEQILPSQLDKFLEGGKSAVKENSDIVELVRYKLFENIRKSIKDGKVDKKATTQQLLEVGGADLNKQIFDSIIKNNPNIDRNLAQKGTDTIVSAGLEKLAESLKTSEESVKEFTNSIWKQKEYIDQVLVSLNQNNPTLTGYSANLRMSNRSMSTANSMGELENQFADQWNRVLSGSADFVKIPEQSGQILMDNIVSQIMTGNAARGDISNIISQSNAGLLDPKQQQILGDTLFIQKKIQDGVLAMVSTASTMNVTDDPEAGDTLASKFGQVVGVPTTELEKQKFFSNSTVTPEAANEYQRIFDTILKEAKESPAKFANVNAAMAIAAEAMGSLGDGRELVDTMNENIRKFNIEMERDAIINRPGREYASTMIGLSGQSLGSTIGQFGRRESLGANPESLLLPGTMTANFDRASASLSTAMKKAEAVEAGNVVSKFKQLASVNVELSGALNNMQNELKKSSNDLTTLRYNFDKTSKVLSGLTATNVGLGGMSSQDIYQTKAYGGVFENLSKNVLGEGFGKYSNYQDLATRASPEEFNTYIDKAKGLAGRQDVQNALQAGSKLGSRLMPGTNTAYGGTADILQNLIGAGVLSSKEDVSKLQEYAKLQAKLDEEIANIEKDQLKYLKQIAEATQARANLNPLSWLFGGNKQTPSTPPVQPVARPATINDRLTDVITQLLARDIKKAGSEPTRNENDQRIVDTLDKLIEIQGKLSGGNVNVNVAGEFTVTGFDGVERSVVSKSLIIAFIEGMIKNLGNTVEELNIKGALEATLREIKDFKSR